eukprot:766510-Hanusia_phi.AAC.1
MGALLEDGVSQKEERECGTVRVLWMRVLRGREGGGGRVREGRGREVVFQKVEGEFLIRACEVTVHPNA